jgi:aspartate 1-decarboxylase
MLNSKIHGATLTGTELHYEGSIAVDQSLLELADMLPGEQVDVLNLNNGARLTTYIIEAPAGSGTVMLNGPASRLGYKGDKVVLLTYCLRPDQEARATKPRVVHVDAQNHALPRNSQGSHHGAQTPAELEQNQLI